MKTTQLELETVTPMFLHGHNNTIVELRTPPFKALLRYWWRATRAIGNSRALHQKEGELFGNTRKRSPLQIRILRQERLKEGKYQPLPHHTGGWGCANCPNENKPCRKNYENNAYRPGEQLTVTLAADNLTYYESIAKLGFLLGGVGNRSRRGFGSVRDTNWDFTSLGHLQTEILQTLDAVAGSGWFVANTTNGSIVSHLGFPKYPVIREIFFGQLIGDFQDLLKKIGQATHNYGDDALGYAPNQNRQERMASPIHVRIQKVGKDYFPIVTQLHLDYPGYELRDLKKQQQFIDAIIS